MFIRLLVFNTRPIQPLRAARHLRIVHPVVRPRIPSSAGSWFSVVNAENFYIVATAPNDPSLQVRISGPYLTEQAAHADLEAAMVEAADIDPSATKYNYTISKVESRQPSTLEIV